MKKFRKLFEAEFKSTFREPAVWGWSIAFPVFLTVIFMIIFGGTDEGESNFEAKVVTVLESPNDLAENVQTTLKYIPVLRWKEDSPVTLEQAEKWVKDKTIDAAIVLPSSDSAKEIELIINKEKENSTLSQAMNGILNSVIQQINYQIAHVEPQLSLRAAYISSGSDKLEYTDFLLTGMIALSIAQAGLFGMAGMVEMRRNGLLKRLMLTPISMKLLGVSNMLVRFILGVVQVVLLTLIGVLFFKASLDVNLLSFLIIFLIGTVSFSAFGFMIASLSKAMDSYMGMANIFSFIMMFLSGIFFELSIMPDYIRPISAILPLTYFVNGIRDSMVYGLDVMNPQLWLNVGVLAAWGLVTFAIGSKFYKWKA